MCTCGESKMGSKHFYRQTNTQFSKCCCSPCTKSNSEFRLKSIFWFLYTALYVWRRFHKDLITHRRFPRLMTKKKILKKRKKKSGASKRFCWAFKSQLDLLPSLLTIVATINQKKKEINFASRRAWRSLPMRNKSGCLKTHLGVRVRVLVLGSGRRWQIGPHCQPL